MTKIDLKRVLEGLYKASAKSVAELDVPEFNFLMVDGEGDPNTAASYREAVEALFSVAYTVKFALKKAQGLDYVVMPLEGLWWADDLSSFQRGDKEGWKWTMMILQPDIVAADVLEAARAEVIRKKALPAHKPCNG